MRATRITMNTGRETTLVDKVEMLQSELASFRTLAASESAAQQQFAEQRYTLLRTEANGILKLQQAELRQAQSEHVQERQGLHQDAQHFLENLQAEHAAANQLYSQQLNHNRHLQEELHLQRAVAESHHDRLRTLESQVASPDRTMPYASPSDGQSFRNESVDPARAHPHQHHAMDADDDRSLRTEIAELRQRNAQLEDEITETQAWTHSVMRDLKRPDQHPSPEIPASSTPPPPSAYGEETRQGGVLLSSRQQMRMVGKLTTRRENVLT